MDWVGECGGLTIRAVAGGWEGDTGLCCGGAGAEEAVGEAEVVGWGDVSVDY